MCCFTFFSFVEGIGNNVAVGGGGTTRTIYIRYIYIPVYITCPYLCIYITKYGRALVGERNKIEFQFEKIKTKEKKTRDDELQRASKLHIDADKCHDINTELDLLKRSLQIRERWLHPLNLTLLQGFDFSSFVPLGAGLPFFFCPKNACAFFGLHVNLDQALGIDQTYASCPLLPVPALYFKYYFTA